MSSRAACEPSVLTERLERGTLLLDGATGTELERRGAPCALPLWSAHALVEQPELVERIHADYAAAGADVLTANTFRTQRRALARGGLGERAAALTRLAVELARRGGEASPGVVPLVIGSAPTLEDCYRPELVPEAAALDREHAVHAENLAAAGVDAIGVETMNSAREAIAAARAAASTGRPFWVSFVCWRGARLLSGDSLSVALEAVLPSRPAAVLVNCLPPSNVAACLPVLRESGLPFGAYANLGAPTPPAGKGGAAREEDCTSEEFAEHGVRWIGAGARLVGGCCGTTPSHIRALAARMRADDGRGVK